jgi:S-formylglutathione hydrolase FrmB
MSQFFTTEISDPQYEWDGLRFLTVKSNALQKRVDVTVFIPSNIEISALSGVVILLHGVYGSHWAWCLKGGVHKIAKQLIDVNSILPMMLVMPSDGLFADGSGYVSHSSQEDYEKWIAEDLIALIREQFPDLTTDLPFFITGLSMGGFGALRLGAKYPHLFRAFSGLSSITHFEQIGLFVSDFEQLKQLANEQDGVLEWVLKNRNLLSPFRFDCGSEDLLIEHNRALHLALAAAGIPHQYEEHSGGHSWEYWHAHIGESLRFFSRYSHRRLGREEK